MSASLTILDSTNNLIWYVAFLVLIPLGIYFTIKLKGLQITGLKESGRVTKDIDKTELKDKKKISALESFMMSLGCRVGVGNIAGVASAIMIGGPGAVFWMWIFTIIISILGFCEAVASQMYKERNENGIYTGGPPFYAKKALGNKNLAFVLAVLLIVLYGVGMMVVNASINMEQVYSVVNNDAVFFAISIAFIVFMAIIVIKGIKTVAVVSTLIVPIMIVAWFAICIITLIINWQNVGNAFAMIFQYAFTIPEGVEVQGFLSIEGVWGGFTGPIGGLLGTVMALGLRKCVFSNEAGVGSISVLSAPAESNHPVKIGYMQTTVVLIDTLVICTLSAITILSYGSYASIQGLDLTDAPLVAKVIGDAFLGDAAGLILCAILFICVFSSVISFYGIVETTSAFFTKDKRFLNALKVLIIAAIFVGCYLRTSNAFAITEILLALCAIPHLIILFRLRHNIIAAYRDYRDQRKAGVERPVFHKSAVPDKEGITEWED